MIVHNVLLSRLPPMVVHNVLLSRLPLMVVHNVLLSAALSRQPLLVISAALGICNIPVRNDILAAKRYLFQSNLLNK